MTTRGQLVLLGTVFAMGGLGGAGLLAVLSLQSHPNEASHVSSPARHDTSDALDRDEQAEPVRADSTTPTAPQQADDKDADSAAGEPLTDVLGKLEHDYQASRSTDPQGAAPNGASQSAPADPPATTAAAYPPPAPVAAAPEAAQQPASDASPPPPVEPQRVAAIQVNDGAQATVYNGPVNVTNVTENTTNEVSLSVSTGYPGVYPVQSYYPATAYYPPQRVSPVARTASTTLSAKPFKKGESPMFPADASASLGPIFGSGTFGAQTFGGGGFGHGGFGGVHRR
jgi:hypothetical protein